MMELSNRNHAAQQAIIKKQSRQESGSSAAKIKKLAVRNRAAQQAIIMELSWQESRTSAGNTHGAEQAGITQLSRQ